MCNPGEVWLRAVSLHHGNRGWYLKNSDILASSTQHDSLAFKTRVTIVLEFLIGHCVSPYHSPMGSTARSAGRTARGGVGWPVRKHRQVLSVWARPKRVR